MAANNAEVTPWKNRTHKIAGIEDRRPIPIEATPKPRSPSLYSVVLSLASANRPTGSRNASWLGRNTVSTRPSDMAPDVQVGTDRRQRDRDAREHKRWRKLRRDDGPNQQLMAFICAIVEWRLRL